MCLDYEVINDIMEIPLKPRGFSVDSMKPQPKILKPNMLSIHCNNIL